MAGREDENEQHDGQRDAGFLIQGLRPRAKQPGDGRHDGERRAENSVQVAGVAFVAAFGIVHVAENDGDDRRDRGRCPKQRRRRFEPGVLLVARSELERDRDENDADRQMQNEHVESAEEKNELHGLTPWRCWPCSRMASGVGNSSPISALAFNNQ